MRNSTLLGCTLSTVAINIYGEDKLSNEVGYICTKVVGSAFHEYVNSSLNVAV